MNLMLNPERLGHGLDEVGEPIQPPAPVAPPVIRFGRPDIDYGQLEEAMANLDAVVRHARATLAATLPTSAGRPQRSTPHAEAGTLPPEKALF